MKLFLFLLSLLIFSSLAFAQNPTVIRTVSDKTGTIKVDEQKKVEPPTEIPLNPFIALKLENAELKAELYDLRRQLYAAQAQVEYRKQLDDAKKFRDEADLLFSHEATRAGVPAEMLKEYKRVRDEKTGAVVLKRESAVAPSN